MNFVGITQVNNSKYGPCIRHVQWFYYNECYTYLKTFSAVVIGHPIARVFQNPGFVRSNPTGGVTFYSF